MKAKFLLFFVMCFCVVHQSGAQINSGKYFTGGSFNIYNAKNRLAQDSKEEAVNVNFQLGKIVMKNTVIGLLVSYSRLKYITPGTYVDTISNNNYGVGIFYRKYKKLARNFTFFGEANGRYVYAENTSHYNTQASKFTSNGGSLSFIPGISYTVCSGMQVELIMPDLITLAYAHEKTDNNTTPPAPGSRKGNSFSVNTNLNANLLSSFGIGFKFLLGKNTGSDVD